MSDNKNVLHKNKLEAFMAWLDKNRIQHRPGKGAYQILQVLTDSHGWQVIFNHEREDPIHYTVNEKLMKTVRRFIRETKREEPRVVAVSPRERELERVLSDVVTRLNHHSSGVWYWGGSEQLHDEALLLLLKDNHPAPSEGHHPMLGIIHEGAREMVAALDGLLAIINEDNNGTYFIRGEAQEAIEYAHQVLEKDEHVGLQSPFNVNELVITVSELTRILEGLLGALNEDKDGGYFICSEAKPFVEEAQQLLGGV